jgi:hypothetical protein
MTAYDSRYSQGSPTMGKRTAPSPRRPNSADWASHKRSSSAASSATQDPEKFSRAAVRWHGRHCREVNAGDRGEPGRPGSPRCLRSQRREAAATALAGLIYRKGSERASEAVMRWATSQKIG